MESFGLSSEDVQNRDQRRLRIDGGTGQLGFTWKVAIKTAGART